MIEIKVLQVGLMRNNVGLLYDKDLKEAIVIDPSYAYSEIKEFCLENGLSVSRVLLTHGHYDHINDVELFQNDGAKVYSHKKALFNINSHTSQMQLSRRSRKIPTIDCFIDDNDIIYLGSSKIKVLYTPGHTDGSCCFIISNIIFAGDTLFRFSYGRYDFVDSSFDKLLKSMNRLLTLEGEYIVYPGHDDRTLLSEEKKFNPILNYIK